MYGNNGAGNHFNRNQHHYWPRGHSYNNPRYFSQSSYTQRDGEQYRRDYKPYQHQSAVYEHDGNPTTMLPSHMIPSVHHDSFYQKGNNTIYNIQTGNFKVNTLQQNVKQGYPSVSNFQPVNYEMSPIMNQSKTQLPDHQGNLFQPGNFACSKVEITLPRAHTQFQPSNVSLYTNQAAASQAVSQDDADKIWLKQWLEQRQLQSTDAEKVEKTLKISEAQNLFQRYLNLNNQLKEDRDVLQKNVDSEPQKWNHFLGKAEKTKEEIKSIESILNDQDIIQNLQEKIHKRKQKRLWLKRRRRRRYLEKQEDEDRRKLLHEKIDVWQDEIKEKDLAARKAASLKHEAGGVLGEVRRKLQDCRKLQDLMKSLVRLRELRKSEGEKKGVYPETSSSEDVNFKTRCEYVEKMVEERSKTYDEEEKALRVIIMEEEGEREKKEKQERLEQKAMLNLSKEADPLTEFTRYYGQADESFQYLIQIRREWDIYLTPDINLGSRIPNEDITAGPPTSSLWASVLENTDFMQEKQAGDNEEKSENDKNEEKTEWKLTNDSQVQFLPFKSTEKLQNIQSQLTKGRKMINAVRLGFNLFRLIKEEQQRKAIDAEVERQRKLDDAKNSMKIISPSESSGESDDEESSTVKIVINEERSDLKSSREDEIPDDHLGADIEAYTNENSSMSTLPTPAVSLKSRSTEKLYSKKKPRSSSIRPYSPVYSNINYPNLNARESLFRQLCALNWILDAMSQDVFPPVVVPITNCWNIKDLLEEARISRRKVERQRQFESNWQTLLVNPSRFSQRINRKVTRRISVHPQHLQRLSAVTSSSSNTLAVKSSTSPVDQKPRLASVSSNEPAETSETAADSEKITPENLPLNDDNMKSTGVRKERGVDAKEKRLMKTKSFTMKSSLHDQHKNQPKQRSSKLSQEELTRLVSSEEDSTTRKTESRVRAWVRQTDQENTKTKFLTAALGTFGAIRLSHNAAEIPSEMRRRFSEVTDERNIMLHDKLESQNKRRWHILQRKFIRLGSSNHIRDALEKIRHDSFSDEPIETGEELRQRVSEECAWYKDLINNFPDDIKSDRYIGIVLNKIAQYGSLEGRKVSVQHFLKIMATLRPWEVCYPEIAAAIEFVRENIVGFSTVEYDDWFSSWNPTKQRSASAPVPS